MTRTGEQTQRMRLAGIGCGGRTRTYLELAAAQPDRYEVVAAADPIPERVEAVRRVSRNPEFRAFASDHEILAAPKLADVMIVGTQDAYHRQPCIAAMEKGYDILLEKPIAQTMDEVLAVEAAACRLGRKVLVCHVLRYTPFYTKVKEIVDSGVLGEIITVNASEGVDPWHQAHSYVRGNWAVVAKATPMIIAKSCHDMDILAWLIGKPCRAVSSFGGLNYFNESHAPAGVPARCTDGCPVGDTCPYNAILYSTQHKDWLSYSYDRAATATNTEILDWLRVSPWGRCVYRCDNTAVDHQVVNFEFEGGITATFTMTAFDTGRNLQIYGTRARLVGGDWVAQHAGADIVVTDHTTGKATPSRVRVEEGGYAGHGGGDPGLVNALYDEMQKPDPSQMRSSIARSVESHAMGFAAEESRRTGQTVRLDEFRACQHTVTS